MLKAVPSHETSAVLEDGAAIDRPLCGLDEAERLETRPENCAKAKHQGPSTFWLMRGETKRRNFRVSSSSSLEELEGKGSVTWNG